MTIQLPPHPALSECLQRQREAYLRDPIPTLAQRQADLRALARMVKEHQEAIIEAINRDYGSRARVETLFAEILVVLTEVKATLRHLRKWMRPQRRAIDLSMFPSSANRVIPQPLGVVGVIVPWNFPLNLSLVPLVSIFAAGNRAMVKMSENSQALAELLVRISSDYFPPEKLQFFVDQAGLGPAFSSLPFDHLIFTGSTQTGRAVMENAARNLTPVTLELGGKSPAIIAKDFPIALAAERIMWVKAFNAGQICTNVDYLFLPAGEENAFAAAAERSLAWLQPDLNHPDYSAIIDDRSFQRLQATLQDAIDKGARIHPLCPGRQPDPVTRKFPPYLLFDVTDDMLVMQREIFGPLLPVKSYRDRQEVADYINRRDRPLALYPFTHERMVQQFYLDHVMSGGVGINQCLLHTGQHDIPFGGVGASGMGHYHGWEGFLTFSKLRPVFQQGPISPLRLFMPPYRPLTSSLIRLLIALKG